MVQINNLPYFKIKNTKRTNYLARFLLKKIKKLLLLNAPYHYLIFHRKDKLLKIIKKLSKKYPYFLRFDIEKFYPSINQEILIKILSHFLTSRQGKKYLQQEIIPFLKNFQLFKKGLPLGNFLAYILAGYYLLPLDFKLIKTKISFIRIQDDYLIFCKTKKQPFKILKEIIEPTVLKLNLSINLLKLSSGKFHQDKLKYLGFVYYGGEFQIDQEKIEEFKKKIIKITHLTKKKQTKAIIKTLNNKILGFGHYYKFAKAKRVFCKLDKFIRLRLRRYILKNKDQKQKIGNLFFSNQYLKQLGLKTLLEIKDKYDKKRHSKQQYGSKKALIFEKLTKKLQEIETKKIASNLLKNEKSIEKIYLKEILIKLEEITKKLKKIGKILKQNLKN